jgi:hypothetical protein
MAVNLKMTIIAIAIAGIGGGGYFVYSTVNKRQEVFNEHVEKFSKNLPSQFKFQKESSEDGLFNSSGVYRLSFNSPLDKKYNGSILINYEASHGLTSLFTGKTNFVGTTKLDGGITKELKIKSADNVFTKIEGNIDSSGNLSMKETGGEVSFVLPLNGNEVNFKVKPFSTAITYDSNSGEINKEMTLPEIKGLNSVDSNITYSLKNTEIKYSANINKLAYNKLGLKIALLEVPSENIKAEGISVTKSAEEKAKKITIKFDSKINKLNSLNYKDAALEFKSSLEDVNKNLFSVYQDALPIYISNHKISEHKVFADAMNSGFSFNIEKFSVKSALEKANITGKIEVSALSEGKIFSLAEQTKFNLSVDTDSVLLEKFINPNSISTSDNSNVAIAINYADKILRVNDIPTQDTLNNSLIDLLSQIEKNNNLGLSLMTSNEVSKEVTVESKTDVEQKKDAIPEVKADIKPEVKDEKKSEVKIEIKSDKKLDDKKQ